MSRASLRARLERAIAGEDRGAAETVNGVACHVAGFDAPMRAIGGLLTRHARAHGLLVNGEAPRRAPAAPSEILALLP